MTEPQQDDVQVSEVIAELEKRARGCIGKYDFECSEPACRLAPTEWCDRCLMNAAALLAHSAPSPEQPSAVQEVIAEDCGLSIDMLDVDKLRDWARNILTHGSDISHWADRYYIASKMQMMATGIEKAVKDIGQLRRLASLTPGQTSLGKAEP